MAPGRLILVVGPSGAGKDTLMRAAAERLADDARYVFPKRLVTREADTGLEDHDSMSRSEFDRLVAAGEMTLAWEAHGLGYIIPGAVLSQVAEGRIAVCNGSRRVVPDALKRYHSVAIIVVTATREKRAERLFARGRETKKDIDQRLAREVPDLPDDPRIVSVDNSGNLEDGIAAFVAALKQTATLEIA